MSDQTKELLKGKSLHALSPMSAFPKDSERRYIAGAFVGQELVDSEEEIIRGGKYFGMYLSSRVGIFSSHFDECSRLLVPLHGASDSRITAENEKYWAAGIMSLIFLPLFEDRVVGGNPALQERYGALVGDTGQCVVRSVRKAAERMAV
jgi:hypothetical protein